MTRRRTALRTLVLLVPLLVAGIRAAAAQTLPDSVLVRLEGQWQGTGTILGQVSRVEMEWARTLAGRFTRLTFVSHIGPPPATQRFEGHAYYQADGVDRWRATWFDSSGLTRPITASGDAGDALVATWGTPETEVGETTYRLRAPDRLEVVDRVRSKDGTWREFGRSTLSRTLRKE